MLNALHDRFCGCKRDPVKTRETLLLRAYSQIHEHGFQGVSLDVILKDSGVTKGALYHHFPNKFALGYAVVDEVIAPMVDEFWIHPVISSKDPVRALKEVLVKAGQTMTADEIRMGCPLNNLSQEMSPVDEGFRKRLDAIYDHWKASLSRAFEAGKINGQIGGHVNPQATATFLIAAMEGCIGMAKNAQSKDVLSQCGRGILDYLDTLRPAAGKQE